MLNKSFGISILCLFGAITSSYAQQYLSLEDCRRLAVENNKTLKIASEEERVAYYEKREAFFKYLPEISFVGTYMRNQKNIKLISPSSIPSSVTTPPFALAPGVNVPSQNIDLSGIRDELLKATEIDVKNIWAGGFTLTQPIFMGGKIVAYNDLRSYAEELSKNMKDTKMTDVIVEVDHTYWQVVSVSNKKKLAEAYVSLLKKMDSDMSAMEEEGVATKADHLSVSVKLNEAEMTLTKVENGLSLSKMLLSQICGLEISDEIVLKDESVESLPIVTTKDSYTANTEYALKNRTELKSVELATKIYKQKEKIATSELMPNLALTANYLWTDPNFFNGVQNKLGGMWNVGVVLKVPITFGGNAAKLNAAKAETRIKQFELEEIKEKIELQVNQETFKLNEANKKLITVLKNAEKADENLRYANVGFEEGVIAASDVLAAQTAWMSAKSDVIDAQIDLMLCNIYLNKALGNISHE